MILYCVRHGESEFNAEKRIQGQTNVDLSPLGRRQSAAVAEALAQVPIQAVFASPLARALNTAQPIAEEHGLAVQTDDRLKEIHAGIFQGLLWSDIEKLHPDEAKHWIAQQPDFVIPGGESRRELMVRGKAAFESIRETGFERVAVVAHGGVLTAALKALLQIPAELNPFSLFNGSLSRLEWGSKIKLVTLNETEHLRGVNDGHESSGGDL
jgi:probable phosphoglycerate mutase